MGPPKSQDSKKPKELRQTNRQTDKNNYNRLELGLFPFSKKPLYPFPKWLYKFALPPAMEELLHILSNISCHQLLLILAILTGVI